MFYLRFGAALVGFFFASVYALAITLIRRDRSEVSRDYGRAIQRLTQPAMGVTVEIDGEEHLESARPCVYIVNHQSAFDVPILSGIFPADTVLVAKRELRGVPLFGWIYQTVGHIYIDRSNRQAALSRLREAEDAIRERGVSVWIFPEGTRSRKDGELLPFKKGAFNLAVAAQVPLLPIVVSPVRPLYDVGRRRMRPGTVQIRVLPPVRTDGLGEDDVLELTDRVWKMMQDAMRGLRTIPQPGGDLAAISPRG